jgi:hypothetical protein
LSEKLPKRISNGQEISQTHLWYGWHHYHRDYYAMSLGVKPTAHTGIPRNGFGWIMYHSG